MSGLRRRKAPQEDLSEPLLGDDAQDSSTPQPGRAAADQQIILHPGFNLEAFVQFVVLRWQAFLSTLSSFLAALLGVSPVRLTVLQAQQVERLRQHLEEPYQPSNPDHAALLAQLWQLSFPDQPAPSSLKSPVWKDMGWQGEDPATDFRGAGVAGLSHLLHLARSHPPLWHQLRHKTQGVRADWEYPFAVAGLNLTFTLADLVQLHSKGKGPAGCAAGRGFLVLVTSEGDRAFEELYVTAFALLDQVWLERKASYMQFNEVMKAVRQRLDAALSRQPRTIAGLQALLGLPAL